MKKRLFILPSFFLALMWLVKILEVYYGKYWGHWGIYPREKEGLVGIITSPFLHGDWLHLLSNTFPLAVLLVGIGVFYPKQKYDILSTLYVFTGLAVWALARPVYHIGASGVVYALLGFFLFSGIIHKNRSAVFVSLLIVILYSGAFAGIVPQEKGISWESHFLGIVVGLITAFVFSPEIKPLKKERKETNFLYNQGYRPLENSKFKYIYKEKRKQNKT
jgi:membrane associated rhomboid family serine protease